MKVKILGIFESPVEGDPDSEVVVFEGSCKVGRLTIETNRYHRLEIVLDAEPEMDPYVAVAGPVICRVCKNEIEDCNAICTDCEGDVRDDD